MKRLAEQTDKNSPQSYDEIYSQRKERGIDKQDLRRWKRLMKHYKGTRILDAGCLDSIVPILAAKKNPRAEIWGIDLAEKTIESMAEAYPFAFFEVQDVYNTKFPKEYFGYIVAGELIEHLEDPSRFVGEAMRILRPGGTLALSTPKEEEIEPGAVDGERHLWSFSEDDIIKMLEPYGEVRTEILGSQYFPFYEYHFPSIIAFCKKHAK